MGPSLQGPRPFNSDIPPPSGPVSLGPGMSGASASGSHHPGFSGMNVMNGPAGPLSGMQSEFVFHFELICVMNCLTISSSCIT
jgi:hypothetical protein